MFIILIIMLFTSCSHHEYFKRPSPIHISDDIYINLNNYPKELNNEASIVVEKDDIQESITNYYNLQTKSEMDFFKNGKLAIDLRKFFRFPLKKYKRISSKYGWRTHPITKKWHLHSGIDLSAVINTKIYAAQKGIVIINKKSKTYGYFIGIKHSNGFVSIYAHNQKNLVKKGDFVKKGQLIGYVGSTGRSTGPHLHFEIRKWGHTIDPLKFYNNQKKIKNKRR